MAEKVTRTAKRLRPFLLSAGQAAVIGRADAMNRIALLDGDTEIATTYPKTDSGMAAALAAASNGDTIMVPPCTLTSNYTIPSGVVVRGWATKWAYFTGQITLSQTSYIRDISIVRSASSSDPLIGVVGPAVGTAVIGNVYIGVTNTGAGDAYCVQGGAGRVEIQISTIFANAASGSGYAIYAGAGGVSMDSGWIYGSTAHAYAATGDLYNPGSEISTGAIPTTDSTGVEIAGLTPNNWYAVEAFNGPYHNNPRMNDDEYDFQAAATVGQWNTRIGRHMGETGVTLDLGPWVAHGEALDANYGRMYFQATTTSIFVRCYDTYYNDNFGAISWRLRNATYGSGSGTFWVNAVRMDDNPVGTPLDTDRSAWNAATYQAQHANDIDSATGIHHTLGSDSDQAAAGDHTHILAEHNHSSSDTGGAFDAANLTSAAATDGYVLTADGSGGAAWELAPVGFANPMTAIGDILYAGDSDGGAARLAIGTDGYVLTSTSDGLPAWEAATGGFSNPMTATGDLIYASDSDGTAARLGIGADGTVLTSTSDGTPAWEAAGGSPKRQVYMTFSGTLQVTSGPLKFYNRLGVDLTILEVHITVETAPTGAAIIADLHEDGTTVFTNQAHRPQIAISGLTGVTTDIDVATWTNGSYLSPEIDQVGSTIAGANLVMTVVCE